MADYHLSAFDAIHRTSMTLALAWQTAARERRGQAATGPDFAERLGDLAVERAEGRAAAS